tara:strand:- start:65 stop:1297 length:1233 start_codon:yes stop_codon:yes gene_type:complete
MKKNSKGLPLKVKFCIECNISNQQPTSTNEHFHTKDTIQDTIKFDENGVCAACNFNKTKWSDKIDWVSREKELTELCNKYRKNNGEYDCIVGGSGGKDSVFQSHVLKYKYKMNPLTVTWAPHLYTDIGWKNFQSWIHEGGFDNYLYFSNPKIMKLVTKESTRRLFHPFQPFIIGQKTFVIKMAARFNIPLIFFGENPGEGGKNISINSKGHSFDNPIKNQEGYTLDPLKGKNFKESYLGGKQVQEYLDDGVRLSDLQSFAPIDFNLVKEKNISIYWLGYYLRWIPQENYYYAVENTKFEANKERIEGSFQKYSSMDDKTDGFFYYTRFIKYGVGRTTLDAAQEIRNKHITKEEGKGLIKRYDGEYPSKYENEFYDYISMTKNEFLDLADKFRPDHIWLKKSNSWELKNQI